MGSLSTVLSSSRWKTSPSWNNEDSWLDALEGVQSQRSIVLIDDEEAKREMDIEKYADAYERILKEMQIRI